MTQLFKAGCVCLMVAIAASATPLINCVTGCPPGDPQQQQQTASAMGGCNECPTTAVNAACQQAVSTLTTAVVQPKADLSPAPISDHYAVVMLSDFSIAAAPLAAHPLFKPPSDSVLRI
jgi:hypothetical protein